MTASPLRPEPSDPLPDRSLDRTLVRGVAWTAMVKWGSQAFSWTAVIVLARLLSKSDYGIVGMATLYLGFVAVLTEGGLGTSIIALRQMSRAEIAQFNSVAVLMGLTGALATCAAAVPLGIFFRTPELPWVVVALSANALLSSSRLVPTALLQRDLRFRGLALVEGAQAITTTATTLVLALLGWRYWALVTGGILGNAVGVVVAYLLSPHPFARPRLAELGRYFHFTRDVLIGRLAWYAYTNADFLVAGRVLGTAALGAYTFAWTIASVPVEKVTALVTRVTPAFFSRLQHDRTGTTRILINITEALTYLTLPASVGLALVADDFVRLYLGPQWTEAIRPLQILAVYATIRSVVTLFPQILTMRRDTRFLMWNGLATAIALPTAFYLGSRWGAAGIAAMWVLVYPVFVIPLFVRTAKALQLPLGRYFAAYWPALRGTAVLAASVVAARAWLPGTIGPVGRLLAEVAVGAGAFLLAGILPQRARLAQLRGLFRGGPVPPLADEADAATPG